MQKILLKKKSQVKIPSIKNNKNFCETFWQKKNSGDNSFPQRYLNHKADLRWVDENVMEVFESGADGVDCAHNPRGQEVTVHEGNCRDLLRIIWTNLARFEECLDNAEAVDNHSFHVVAIQHVIQDFRDSLTAEVGRYHTWYVIT